MANLYPKARARKTPSNSLGVAKVAPMPYPELTNDMPEELTLENNYGLSRPEMKPQSKAGSAIETALSIGLPALIAGMSGEGAVQGATAGYLGMQGAKNAGRAGQEQAFQKERDFRQRDVLGREKMEADQAYKRDMLEIGRANADTNRKRADNIPQGGALTEIERVAAAQARADRAIASGMEPDDNDLALIELWERKTDR